MDFSLQHVTRFCFGASYAVALFLELLVLLRPRQVVRWVGLGFGAAGLLAHSLFLMFHRPRLVTPNGSLLALAWVIAVFYLYGTLHYRRLAWALFVLPLVLGLVALAGTFPPSEEAQWFTGETFWGAAHGSLVLLAAIGLSIACLASLMYLVQAARLRSKAAPGEGLRLPSLERLAMMNRRAIMWAFPLLTAGLLLGLVLLALRDGGDWTAPRVAGTVGLWLTFALLIYLRYAAQISNRRLAVLTIAAFGLLLVTLIAAHPVAGGAAP